MTDSCPLCAGDDVREFHRDERREYRQCGACALVFVPPAYHLPPDEEKTHYDHHENDPADPRYRAFLKRLFEPLRDRLAPNRHGLDFGSGPGPTLSVMFEEAGHRVDMYDPYYAADDSVWERTYDFITASEVLEHLHHPGRELDRLWSILKPGGLLGVMTQLVISRDRFAHWRYTADPTHVCFYAPSTLEWLARHWRAEIVYGKGGVCLFRKAVTRRGTRADRATDNARNSS